MNFKQEIKGKIYAANSESNGVFCLVGGAYQQLRGNSQTPKFLDAGHFRSYVLRMLRNA